VGLSEGQLCQELMSEMTQQSCNLIIKRTYMCIVWSTVTWVIISQNNSVAVCVCVCVSACTHAHALLLHSLYRGEDQSSERSDIPNTCPQMMPQELEAGLPFS
jgi:hypothetical protein